MKKLLAATALFTGVANAADVTLVHGKLSIDGVHSRQAVAVKNNSVIGMGHFKADKAECRISSTM